MTIAVTSDKEKSKIESAQAGENVKDVAIAETKSAMTESVHQT